MLAQLRTAYESGLPQFRPAYADDAIAITIIDGVESGNIDPSLVTVADETGASPTIWLDTHYELDREMGGNYGWRHLMFAIENAEGKTPVFRANRSTKSNKTEAPTTEWRPLWTQDFVTYHRAPSRTLVGGSTGYIEWQFSEAMPSGRVYVLDRVLGLQSHHEALAAQLLADYPSVASPTASADESGVFHVSPAENDQDGIAVGAHPMHALKLAWGGPTTDGARKRKLVMFAGIHAAGEAGYWPAFVSAIRWMLDDASSEAQAFRLNWDVYLYFALTPNGLYSGHCRTNGPARTTDPNRVFVLSGTPSLDEIAATCAAAIADTAGKCDAFFSWHCHPTRTELWIPGKSGPNYPTADANHSQFVSTGNAIFGTAAYDYAVNLFNTDAWWGQVKLGAKVAFDAEFGTLGTTDPALFEVAGRNWMKTLQAVDAQGLFLPPIELAGASIVATASTGSLTTGIALAGSASSMTLAGGVLTAQIRLQGSALAGAIAAAGLTSAIQLAAIAQAGASATGDLTVGNTIDLAGNAQAAALAAGSITTIIRFEAAAVAKVLGAGTLTAPGAPSQLAADATVLAIAEGGLTTGINLRGAAASVVQASGTLDVALTFEAQAFAAAMSSGVLSTQIRMEAAAVAGALARADLTGGVPVVPPTERTIPVRAQTRVVPVRAQTRLIPA